MSLGGGAGSRAGARAGGRAGPGLSRQRGPKRGSEETGHRAHKSGTLLGAAGKQGEVGMGPKLTGKGTWRVEPRESCSSLSLLPKGQLVRGHPSP